MLGGKDKRISLDLLVSWFAVHKNKTFSSNKMEVRVNINDCSLISTHTHTHTHPCTKQASKQERERGSKKEGKEGRMKEEEKAGKVRK